MIIAFVILKLTGVLGIGWGWIALTIPASIAPMGATVCFILLKCLGGFTVNVSWWWIIAFIAYDLIELYLGYEKISDR